MAREGTRSSTGHAAPRQFATVDTAPAIKRKPATKKAGTKPTGVTKKVAPKKENSVVKKARYFCANARDAIPVSKHMTGWPTTVLLTFMP